MNTYIVNPTRLTAHQLIQLGQHTLHELALKASGTTTAYRLVLGRCLLALQRARLFAAYGCSSVIHYATTVLGKKAKEARDCRRVAKRLEPLPQLSHAVQEGTIDWSKVREVIRVAAPETDAFWLNACLTMTYDEIYRLVRLTLPGQLPQLPAPGDTRPVCTELRCMLSPEGMIIMERAQRSLSEINQRVVPMGEVMVLLAAEHLAGHHLDEQSLAQQREEARKDLAAQHQRDRWLLAKCPARDIFETAVAARCTPCPGNENIQLVQRENPPWENLRLRYNPDSRQPTEAQRQEILRRDGYRCSTPGCPHHLFLHTHHIVFYSENGPTLPDNLVVLCSKCHRHVHEGHLRIEGRPGSLKFYDRKGQELQRKYELSVADWLNFWIGWTGKESDSHVHRRMDGLWSFTEQVDHRAD